ncbi:MAG: hypothetical protein ACTSRA_14210, partial [Promethearchaeota archaeon]
AFTRGNNYFPFHGPSEKKRIKRKYLYAKRHQEGILTGKCSEYIDLLIKSGIKPASLPLVLDGSWNYPSYGGVYLWMGRYRLWWEKDGYARSETFKSRNLLLAVKVLLDNLDQVPRHVEIKYKMAWKHLLLAEVSDSTGQTPVPTEVRYTFNESRLCKEYCKQIIQYVRKRLKLPENKKILVNCGTKTFNIISDSQAIEEYNEYTEGIPSSLNELKKELVSFDIQAWNISKGSFKIRKPMILPNAPSSKYKLKEYYLYLDFKGKPTFLSGLIGIARANNNFRFHERYDKWFGNYVGIKFPLREDKLIFSPSLMENDVLEIGLDDIRVNETIGKTFLPLPNGMLGIGDDLFIIKHNNYFNTHIAATINVRERWAGFLQDAPPTKLKSRWKFSIIKGPAKHILVRANELNVHPIVLL